MKKALEILHRAKRYNAHITESELDEAIAGLEEAMKPKTCIKCYWWNDFYSQCDDHDNSLAGVGDYGCNRYEAKDTQC